MFKYAMPVVYGRGAGLGNELIVWSKAYLGAQITGAKLLHPAWGLNKRQYWRLFGTSRFDFVAHAILRRTLPVYTFTEPDYRANGSGDMAIAIQRFAERNRLDRRENYVLAFEGLWGGIGALSAARPFVRSVLLNSRFALGNLFAAEKRIGKARLRIGVHIRRGDFGAPTDAAAIQGRFNVALPLDWYTNVCRRLYARLGDTAIFLIVSDASAEELRPLTDNFPCVTTQQEKHTDISDLLLLASSDFIVCSVSSFSVWAAFLSEGRYGWFAPNLVEHDGYLSIWGNEPWQSGPQGDTAMAREYARRQDRKNTTIPRGVSVGTDGALPLELLSQLESTAAIRNPATDFIRYGTVHISTAACP